MVHSRLAELFAENFARFGELGASVSVWHQGREVVALAGGFQDRQHQKPWTAETFVLFWSATKGPAAACLLHACQEHQVEPTTAVAAVWPEFAQAGKGAVTIAELLSHRAGLTALAAPAPILDRQAVVAALAAAAPEPALGPGHAYHPRTLGFLVDETLRRITGGRTLQAYWREEFADPLGLDVWIGVPPERAHETAEILIAKTALPLGDPFFTAFLDPTSLTARAFASPRGLRSVASMNTPEARTASLGAFGGVGTARGLAKFYALLAEGGALAGRRWFAPRTLEWMRQTLTQGFDPVLLTETAFSMGFMQDPVDATGRKMRTHFGPSLQAFGSPGAGGSHAFADPEHCLSFAYVMNQMEPGALPGPKALRLIDALYAEIRDHPATGE